MELDIPSHYLKECRKDVVWGEAKDLAELADKLVEAEREAKECLTVHNSFVEYYCDRHPGKCANKDVIKE